MKNFKRFASVVMVIMMMLSMMLPAMAQTVGSEAENTGSITISNAAKGVTYAVYKLFDASVTGNEGGGAIAYTGDIPDSLKAFFTEDEAGNIFLAKNVEEEALFAALKTWAATATATADAESDGSVLVFEGLGYGYYVVTTTQGNTAITVTSTNPNATVVDKNSTAFTGLTKTVDDNEDENDDENDGINNVIDITDTVTYTVEFITSNYNGSGEDAEAITTYTINDTLPEFLADVNVTSIIIDDDADTSTTEDQHDVTVQFDDEKKIVLTWYENNAFLYDNGAKVILTYTAKVTNKAAIASANTNTVTVTPSSGTPLTETADIFTYSFTLKKTDDKNNVLEGATFQFPFYVEATPNNEGAYIYAGETAAEGLVNTLTTPKSGIITIVGVGNGEYSIEETVAPNGYNKLVDPIVIIINEDGTVTYQEGTVTEVVVVNKTGTELPSTGGIGTTIFYCAGAVLAVGAFVLLITKKRMSKEV